MTKNPITIEKSALAAKALSLMNNKKITSLCVFIKDKKRQLAFFMFIQYFSQIYINDQRFIIQILIGIFIIVIIFLFQIIKEEEVSRVEQSVVENLDTTTNIINDVNYSSKDAKGMNIYYMQIKGK